MVLKVDLKEWTSEKTGEKPSVLADAIGSIRTCLKVNGYIRRK